MSKTSRTSRLRQSIALLEAKRAEELIVLKKQFHEACEHLKPVNLIKNTMKEVAESPDVINGMGNAALGLASGYMAKNVLFSSTKNPLLKLVGVAVQAVVTGLVTKNSDKIKETGMDLIKSFTAPKPQST